MDPDRWNLLRELFEEARNLPKEERSPFLTDRCTDDESLRREIEALLESDEAVGLGLSDPTLPETDADPDLVGREVGEYRVESEIGRGGMGRVYRARDIRLGRQVALKILPTRLASDTRFVARFKREARILASLNHSNIPAIYDVVVHEGQLVLILELVDGVPLSDLIAQGPLPAGEAAEVGRQIAEALEAAHESAVVHRDLKPNNVMISPGGSVRVLDFGIAKIEDRLSAREPSTTDDLAKTLPGQLIGTTPYMSPEQIRGERIDRRTDIWAFGVVLFELLSGKLPFLGTDPAETLARILEREPNWAALPAPTPPKVRRLLERCLDKQPALRPQSMAEARRVLEDPFDPEDATLQRGRGRGWRSRRVGLAVVAAAVIAALGLQLALSRSGPRDLALDRNRIMVFPLVYGSGEEASIGEDAATMIGHALDRAGDLRTVDAWRLLNDRERRDFRSVGQARVRQLAIAGGAAFTIEGRIVASGAGSITVALESRDVAGDTVLQRASATGSADRAWRAGLVAVNQLLPRLIPTGGESLEAVWDRRSPAGIANFLQGERAYRRIRFGEALDHYRNSIAADSGFGLAALRAAQASVWTNEIARARSFVDLALAQELAPVHAEFARGLEAYFDGRADEALVRFERVVAENPDMALAWMQIGEVYSHLVPRRSRPDSAAEEAFATAHRLDPSAAYSAAHLLQYVLLRGDLERAEPLLNQLATVDPEGEFWHPIDLLYGCVEAGPAGVDWDSAVRDRPDDVLVVGAAASAAQPRCALAAFRSILAADAGVDSAVRSRAVIGAHNVLVVMGREVEATALVDSVTSVSPSLDSTRDLYIHDAIVGLDVEHEAERAAEHLRERWLLDPEPSPVHLWRIGIHDAMRGSRSGVERIASSLSEIARLADARQAPSGAIPGVGQATRTRLLAARAIAAHLALTRADTARALEDFRDLIADASASPDNLEWDDLESLPVERLRLGQLLHATGRHEEALKEADAFDSPSPVYFVLYLAASLELRIEAAQALGDSLRAKGYRSRLEGLRGDDH